MLLADLNADGGLLPYVPRLSPDAIVYDVGPPYIENWSRLRGVLATGVIDAPVIVTSTDPEALREHTDGSHIYALIGKPFELETLTQRLREALDQQGVA